MLSYQTEGKSEPGAFGWFSLYYGLSPSKSPFERTGISEGSVTEKQFRKPEISSGPQQEILF